MSKYDDFNEDDYDENGQFKHIPNAFDIFIKPLLMLAMSAGVVIVIIMVAMLALTYGMELIAWLMYG